MIMFDIIRSKEESDRVTDFVAIGNIVRNGKSTHAAFVIQYEKVLYEFHYTSTSVELSEIIGDYYHKITETISPDEVPAFIAYCKNIQKNANPVYGYFYSGESYDLNGKHVAESGLGEIMTCVGFCLNVLKGFLEEEYLVFSEWNAETHDSIGYLESFCEYHGVDPSKIADSHRRITPRECLASCFFHDLPIPKQKIEDKLVEVDQFFSNRLCISNN